jgi:hypothetical protein
MLCLRFDIIEGDMPASSDSSAPAVRYVRAPGGLVEMLFYSFF